MTSEKKEEVKKLWTKELAQNYIDDLQQVRIDSTPTLKEGKKRIILYEEMLGNIPDQFLIFKKNEAAIKEGKEVASNFVSAILTLSKIRADIAMLEISLMKIENDIGYLSDVMPFLE